MPMTVPSAIGEGGRPGRTPRGAAARIVGLLALLALCLIQAAPAAAQSSLEEITYLTEEYYPYNYTEEGRLKGLSVDLLRLTWQELGVPEQPIESLPWARAFQLVQNEPGTMLFSTARTASRDRKFHWAGPIMIVRFVLIAKKRHKIILESLRDVAGYTIGTLREDISDNLLADYRDIARIEPVADMQQNIAKFLSNRLDMIAYEERSWLKMAARNGLSPSDYETVYVLRETPVYYAFHGDTPVELVRGFQDALDRVKASPAYTKLMETYLD